MNVDREAIPEDWMPICSICKNPMRLVDVRAKAAALGLRTPNDDEQYVIECCGRRMRIDNRRMLEICIRNLKAFYGTNRQDP